MDQAQANKPQGPENDNRKGGKNRDHTQKLGEKTPVPVFLGLFPVISGRIKVALPGIFNRHEKVPVPLPEKITLYGWLRLHDLPDSIRVTGSLKRQTAVLGFKLSSSS